MEEWVEKATGIPLRPGARVVRLDMSGEVTDSLICGWEPYGAEGRVVVLDGNFRPRIGTVDVRHLRMDVSHPDWQPVYVRDLVLAWAPKTSPDFLHEARVVFEPGKPGITIAGWHLKVPGLSIQVAEESSAPNTPEGRLIALAMAWPKDKRT